MAFVVRTLQDRELHIVIYMMNDRQLPEIKFIGHDELLDLNWYNYRESDRLLPVCILKYSITTLSLCLIGECKQIFELRTADEVSFAGQV